MEKLEIKKMQKKEKQYIIIKNIILKMKTKIIF